MEKKKLILYLFVILIVGALLRLININKPEGMWNDEYLTWEIAKASFPNEFFQAILRNCHAPLHYIYLKVWMYFLGDSDLSLRFSSYFAGILSIISMFFLGKHLGKKTSDTNGLICAWFASISAFLIYFSQEVRIYSLLFLLSSINALCALKTMDNPTKKNCTFFVLTSVLVMLEHTIGFVFVFFSVISVLLFADKKTKFKRFLVSILLVGLILLIPLCIFIYNTMFHQQYFSQWWAPFSWAKLAFFFTDLFSPYLINITNAPPEFMSMVYGGGKVNLGFILFAFIPLIISVLCMIRALFSFDKNVKYFILTSVGVYLTVFVASLFGKIIFLTKYLTEIYPILILFAVFGFSEFKSKAFKAILGTVYSTLILFFILVSNYSPVKLVRAEGQNIPVTMLNVLDYKTTDKVVFLYYPKERFLKYSKEIANSKNTSDISKYNFNFIKSDKETMSETYEGGNYRYKEVFLADENKGLDIFLDKNVYSKIKNGEKFFLVDFSPVSIFNNQNFLYTLDNDKKYNQTPLLFLVFSYIRNYIVQHSQILLSFSGVVSHEGWRIYIFEKT